MARRVLLGGAVLGPRLGPVFLPARGGVAMSADWVTEARERAERATPGPWEVERRDCDNIPGALHDRSRVVIDRTPLGEWVWHTHVIQTPDAAFIAAARTDLPRALDVIQAADVLEQAVEAALAYMAQTKPAGLPPLDYVTYSQLTAALAAYQAVRK